MTSEKLQKARDYEANYKQYADPERPVFHATGTIGWINDPNGFSVYKDRYHLFYQYYPYDVQWGPMHWGHCVTDDFIKWEYLPCAMAPDTEADCDGCFSGGAIEMEDGRQLLMYTGVYHEMTEDGRRQEFQHQCIAVGDGIDYEKYDGNPVLTAADLPEGGNRFDFRDPHIWKDGDAYYSIIGNRPADGSGSLVVYESKDGFHWKFKTILDACYNEYGKMWECPDFFELDGKYIALTSPQEMAPLGLEFHAGYGSIALMGSFDKAQFKFYRENVQSIDYGIDFYAPQTLLTPDGRRIMIAWMENWTNVSCKLPHSRLHGAMTLPRELSVKNGRLIQNPVREIEKYYGRRVHYDNVIIRNEINMNGVFGRCLDMTVTVKPLPNMTYQWFKLHLAKDGEHEVVIRYKPETNIIRIDRSRCGGRFDIVHVRDFAVYPHAEGLKLRIIMDGNSVELFVNDGEQAATFKLYNKTFYSQAITFEADTQVLITVDKHDIIMK